MKRSIAQYLHLFKIASLFCRVRSIHPRRRFIQATVLILLLLLIQALMGMKHIHAHDLGVFVHKHAPVSTDAGSHSKDHENHDILILEEFISINKFSAIVHPSIKPSKDDSRDTNGDAAVLADTMLRSPQKLPGNADCSVTITVKDQILLHARACRAPPRTH